MAPLSPPTLTDGAIILRPAGERDVPAMVSACQDPEIPRWTRVPSPYTPEDAHTFLALAAGEAAAGEGLALAIADPEGALVGTIGLMGVDRERDWAEIGYWTAASARRRGIAVRAVVLLRDWAHAQLGLRELEIHAHRDNLGSQRVAERAGFTPTGRVLTMHRMPPGRRAGYMVYVWRPA